MTGFTIVSSSVEDTPRGPMAKVVLIPDAAGAGPVLHMFPLEALEWRAAEYGIDPGDAVALLDIVLHEPYVAEEPVVHTAVSVEVARAVHLRRIAAVKAVGTAVRTTAGEADPLLPVKTAYATFLDLTQVRAKTRFVEQHRAAVRAGASRRAATPAGIARRPIGGQYEMTSVLGGDRA